MSGKIEVKNINHHKIEQFFHCEVLMNFYKHFPHDLIGDRGMLSSGSMLANGNQRLIVLYKHHYIGYIYFPNKEGGKIGLTYIFILSAIANPSRGYHVRVKSYHLLQ